MHCLKYFPILERVVLKVKNGFSQHLSLLADNPVEWVASPEESRLHEFTLQGKRAMHEDDLTTFLVDYTSNLVKATMNRIHENWRIKAETLMVAIDKLTASSSTEDTRRSLGRRQQHHFPSMAQSDQRFPIRN